MSTSLLCAPVVGTSKQAAVFDPRRFSGLRNLLDDAAVAMSGRGAEMVGNAAKATLKAPFRAAAYMAPPVYRGAKSTGRNLTN